MHSRQISTVYVLELQLLEFDIPAMEILNLGILSRFKLVLVVSVKYLKYVL